MYIYHTHTPAAAAYITKKMRVVQNVAVNFTKEPDLFLSISLKRDKIAFQVEQSLVAPLFFAYHKTKLPCGTEL